MKFVKLYIKIWNIIGLLDIISVIISATYFTKLAIENKEDGVVQFGSFPFSWIPAFAPVTIIFLHLLLFKKMKKKNFRRF